MNSQCKTSRRLAMGRLCSTILRLRRIVSVGGRRSATAARAFGGSIEVPPGRRAKDRIQK